MTSLYIISHICYLGNTAQRLWYRYAVRFFVRLPKFAAGILTYFKVNLGDMTENLQVDVPQSSQAVLVRCCLYVSKHFMYGIFRRHAGKAAQISLQYDDKLLLKYSGLCDIMGTINIQGG